MDRPFPLTPVYTYADTRAENEANLLRTELDESEIHDRTGCHLHSSYLPVRFRWLAKNRPDVFYQVDRWLSTGEYIERTCYPDKERHAIYRQTIERQQRLYEKLINDDT